ncbi:MAG TPA: ABC transporter permease [Polyangia bacterium]|nr:ABC transporter permease [Polyangia bacterium]
MGIGVSIGALSTPAAEPSPAAAAAAAAASAEARRAAWRKSVESVAIPIGAIVAALLLFGIFVALTGRSPLAVYHEMYRGSFGTWFSFQNTLQRSAPIMLTALATAIPLRLGLVVLGGEGAMVLGGLAAAAIGIHLHSPFSIKLGMFVTGALVGGAWIAGAGALRAYRGVNETISSLLLNYIAIALLNHMVEGPLRDPASLNKPSTLPIGDDNMLGNLPGLDVHWGLGFGLIACFLAWFLMQRTTFGFSARMVGGNIRAALLNGLPVRRLIVLATFLGGLGAGLAGAVEVAAIHGNANASLVTGYGYTGVLVAFIARANPLGVVPVALLLGGIGASGGLLQRVFELPDATVNVLQGVIFIAILFSDSLYGRRWGRVKLKSAVAA